MALTVRLFLSCFLFLSQYTDEEVECSYEEFYEDVHTEFLKYGEIVNFKVLTDVYFFFWQLICIPFFSPNPEYSLLSLLRNFKLFPSQAFYYFIFLWILSCQDR